MYLNHDLYCMWLWVSQNKLFLPSASNEKSAIWWFPPRFSFGLLHFFLSPPLMQIQTITRQAVILPGSGMSENLLLISHVKKKRLRKWGFCLGLFGPTQMELWLQLIRRRCHTHYCMKHHYKNTMGDRKGTYRFDFGGFRPVAALWDCRWGSASMIHYSGLIIPVCL